MKKTIIAPLATALLLAATACSHFTWDDTGDYGGNWYLTEVDSLSTGDRVDYAPKRVFWAIQGKILEVTDKSEGSGLKDRGIVFHYEQKKDSLLLWEPRYNVRENGDPEVDNVEALKPFGINSLRDSFYVEKINGDKMVLRGKLVRLRFKNF